MTMIARRARGGAFSNSPAGDTKEEAHEKKLAAAAQRQKELVITKNTPTGLNGQAIIAPTFEAARDGSGALKSGLTANDQMDTRALDKLREDGLRSAGTNSTWADLMLQKNADAKTAGIDSITNQAASGRADMLNSLASQGGADSGARERSFGTFNRNSMLERQRANRDFGGKNLDILTQDESNRKTSLNSLNDAETNRATYKSQLEQFNVGNKFKDIQSQRDFNMNTYNKEMEGWAAGKQADAQKGGRCFAPDTLITMASGEKKRIADIRLKDKLLLGGEVTMIFTALRKHTDKIYNYGGVFVTAQHAVYEDKSFVRVENSKIAKEMKEVAIPVVYNLSTTNHVIIAEGIVFGDYDEVTMIDEATALKELNNGIRRFVS